jgi:predicted DsbA family dithiol-disulfide isomerase
METETVTPEVTKEASIIVVSDFVCPWCYVGLTEIERLSQEYDFEVHLAPYLLRPETPPEGMPARHIVPLDAPPTALEERGSTLGIKFARGRTWTPNSHYALEGSAFAYDYGDQWRYHRAVFQAYFEELKDIGNIDTLVEVGAGAGLDASSMRKALEDGIYREQVDAGIKWSREIGVTAIPTFIINEQWGLVGAQELPVFRSVLDRAGQPRKT